jgi:murein DD-endopeptidase MepM/ murein hydrolase activator NlpD
LRWLAGTVLTGLAGAALIGSAIYAALDRKPNFAETPEFAQATHKDDATGELVNPGKSDRLVQSVDVVAAKQSFRAPTTVQVGSKSVVKVRAFTHVSTTLETTSGGQADEVPSFNPLKLITDAPDQPPPPPADAAPIQDDEEISYTMRDLAGVLTGPSQNVLQPDEIQAQVAEEVKAVHNPITHPLGPLAPQMLLMRTTHAGLDPSVLGYEAVEAPTTPAPFSSIAVRMVPENVTLVARSPDSTGNLNREQLVIVRHGDSLEDILRAAGAAADQIKGIVAAFKIKNGQPPVAEGQRIKLTFVDMDGKGTSAQIARLSVYNDETLQATIALDDSGHYVQVQQPNVTAGNTKPKGAGDDDDDDDDASGLHLYNSFYETALKQNIPRPIIDELVRIFGNDVDFQRPVRAGDSFDAFYQNADEIDNRDELLYASITTHNTTYKYFRYQTTDDGLVDYYDESGRSNRKFLLRQPVASARLTSPFGSREHPILGYVRMHTGVDWAAPMGTPIFAAGNGVIVKAGRESGYGNRIEIQHANGYITTYSHLSGFARGVAEGVHVRQGQVIAYLGMTGLATGPHIHYEVIVNGHFVDPLRVKLARTRELNGPTLDDFKRERDRINSLMAQGPGAAPAGATAEARR